MPDFLQTLLERSQKVFSCLENASSISFTFWTDKPNASWESNIGLAIMVSVGFLIGGEFYADFYTGPVASIIQKITYTVIAAAVILVIGICSGIIGSVFRFSEDLRAAFHNFTRLQLLHSLYWFFLFIVLFCIGIRFSTWEMGWWAASWVLCFWAALPILLNTFLYRMASLNELRLGKKIGFGAFVVVFFAMQTILWKILFVDGVLIRGISTFMKWDS